MFEANRGQGVWYREEKLWFENAEITIVLDKGLPTCCNTMSTILYSARIGANSHNRASAGLGGSSKRSRERPTQNAAGRICNDACRSATDPTIERLGEVRRRGTENSAPHVERSRTENEGCAQVQFQASSAINERTNLELQTITRSARARVELG